MINNRNIFKGRKHISTMPKKEVSVSLDDFLLSIVDSLCKENLGAKRSTIINKLLSEHPEIKKRLRKKCQRRK